MLLLPKWQQLSPFYKELMLIVILNYFYINENNSQGEWLKMKKIWQHHRQLMFAIASGVFVATAWMMETLELSFGAFLLYMIAYAIGGYYKAKEGLFELIYDKKLSVEVLMILAAIGALFIGHYMEGAILIFIFALSGALETYTMNKSEKELSKLIDLQPEVATVIENGEEKTVRTEDLKIGERVIVRAGERIPADGIVLEGTTAVDESALTGEAVPIEKSASSYVFSGTVNLTGTIIFEVTKKASETLFQKIIHLVQSAKEERSEAQQLIERLEGPYVKIVLMAVIVMMFLPHYAFGWSFEQSFYRAIVLLVVASPCALVASIMPATLSAISNRARAGVLFKGGVHLEQLGYVKAIGFDKTGTITQGTPAVTDVFVNEKYNEPAFFAAVAAIEKETSHPLAEALIQYCEAVSKETAATAENVQTVSGWGLKAAVNGKTWKIGKSGFFSEELIDNFYPNERKRLLNEGKTIVYAGNDEEIFALFALEDMLRDEAKEAFEQLRKMNIKTIMITGDNETTAKNVAKKANLDGYIANRLPDEKVSEVKKLREKYKYVAMVGDGINDSPALASANVGIAMGSGTDVAIETADAVLMKNDLRKIPETIQLAKKMNRIIKQNIAFSIAMIILLIIGNLFEQVDLPLGVIGHEGSTLLVILNGLRLLKS